MSKIGKHVSEWFDAGLVVCAGLFAGVAMLVACAQYEAKLVKVRTIN